MSIGLMTPAEAAKSIGDRDMRWTNHRHLAIKSRDDLDITENSLPLLPNQMSPAGVGLQSTFDSD